MTIGAQPSSGRGRGSSATLTTELIASPAEIEALVPSWDALAAEAASPGALPGWQLAWWRILAPRTAELRVVVVREEDELVGLVPLVVEHRRDGRRVHRLLGAAMTHRVEPLARRSAIADVARLTWETLAAHDCAPDELVLDGIAGDGPWLPALAAGAAPARRPWALEERTVPAPFIDLRQESFAAWLGERSSNFRQQTRRFRRRLASAGGSIRMSQTPAELERDVPALMQLHHQRWDARGGSSLSGGAEAMIHDAARTLLPSGRLRLWMVELDGTPVGAALFLAAGGNVLYWNGGFDPAHAELKPALLGIVAGIEDCFERGDRHIDLGGGAHDYKMRLADGTRPLVWTTLVPRSGRYARTRLALLPRQLVPHGRRALAALPPDLREQLRPVLRRLPSP